MAASAAAAAAAGLGHEAAVIFVVLFIVSVVIESNYYASKQLLAPFASLAGNPQSPLREGARCRARVRQSLPCLDPTHGTHGLAEIVDSYCVS